MHRYKSSSKPKARALRKGMTDAERKLWRVLRKKQLNGLQFYRQKPIEKYIVDFYCHAKNLVIEIDGGQHYQEENQQRDKERDLFLSKVLKLKILRFTNLDILNNIDGAIDVILDELK